MVSGFMEIQSGAVNLLTKPELKTKADKNCYSRCAGYRASARSVTTHFRERLLAHDISIHVIGNKTIWRIWKKCFQSEE